MAIRSTVVPSSESLGSMLVDAVTSRRTSGARPVCSVRRRRDQSRPRVSVRYTAGGDRQGIHRRSRQVDARHRNLGALTIRDYVERRNKLIVRVQLLWAVVMVSGAAGITKL